MNMQILNEHLLTRGCYARRHHRDWTAVKPLSALGVRRTIKRILGIFQMPPLEEDVVDYWLRPLFRLDTNDTVRDRTVPGS